ncbi:PREDICTED: 39S ribosomal protein L42, mitochondrial-like [Priapulus caudatus]|uniref:Large ribosomal subunit protein mL42 n=1 Tax=Priapulus caudatus TaxID=37621 RepID=A0ABM1F1U3_PRICU|nr:PREDICTED: 39S ribosomal protein L42, mitochondrial-like [Priapulus caudatus]
MAGAGSNVSLVQKSTTRSCAIILRNIFNSLQKTSSVQSRSCSSVSSRDTLNEDRIVLTDDGSTIVCYHPAKEFPYEHTRPLSRNEDELRAGESVLNVQHLEEYRRRYEVTRQGPTRTELVSMFNNARHLWFPNNKKKRARRDLGPDDGTLAKPNQFKEDSW